MKNSLSFLCFILLFFCTNILLAQKGQIAFSNYQIAEDSLFLLKNKTRIIPLKNIDQLRIASLSIGLAEINPFQETLSKYIKHTQSSLKVTDDLSSMLNSFNAISTENDLLFIGLQIEEVLSPEIKSFLNFHSKKGNVILCLWGSAEIFQAIDQPLLDQINTIIWSPLQDGITQSLSVQLTMGAWGASNKLKKPIAHFAAGSGLTTKGNLRLGYAPPEAVGMDSSALHSQIKSIANEALVAKAFPGMQVLVAKDSKVIFHEAYGYHTYEKEKPLKITDIYDWASVTKITAPLPALMKLHGQGKFRLDARLKTYFPKLKRSNKGDLRMRSILAHQAQLKAWIPYWKNTINEDGSFKRKTLKSSYSKRYPIRLTDDLFLHKKYKKRQIYKAIKDSPLRSEKGYKYSGLVFYLFPEIISHLSDQDYEAYLQNTFYKPLGANTVGFNPLEKGFTLDEIVPTERDTFFRKVQLHGVVHDEGAAMMGGVSGNAGLFGNANDLAKIAQMYLNKGVYGGERFIKKESIEEFTKCQYCEEDNRRGLGFDKPLIEYHPQNSSTAQDASPKSYGHSGYTGTFVWIDPDENLIYIFFSNRVFPTRENGKIYQLNIRPRIHQILYESL